MIGVQHYSSGYYQSHIRRLIVNVCRVSARIVGYLGKQVFTLFSVLSATHRIQINRRYIAAVVHILPSMPCSGSGSLMPSCDKMCIHVSPHKAPRCRPYILIENITFRSKRDDLNTAPAS